MLKTVNLYNPSRFGLEYIWYVKFFKIGTLLLQKIVKNKPTFKLLVIVVVNFISNRVHQLDTIKIEKIYWC